MREPCTGDGTDIDHVMMLYGSFCAEMFWRGEEMGEGWDVRYITHFYDMMEGGAGTLLLPGAESRWPTFMRLHS
jgi:hypothetical protein